MDVTGIFITWLTCLKLALGLTCYKCSHNYMHSGVKKIDKYLEEAIQINEECIETGREYTKHEVATECTIPDTTGYPHREFELYCSKIAITGTATFAGQNVKVVIVHRGCRIYHPSMGYKPEMGCDADVKDILTASNMRAKDISGAICYCKGDECNAGSHVTSTSLVLVVVGIVTAFNNLL